MAQNTCLRVVFFVDGDPDSENEDIDVPEEISFSMLLVKFLIRTQVSIA